MLTQKQIYTLFALIDRYKSDHLIGFTKEELEALERELQRQLEHLKTEEYQK